MIETTITAFNAFGTPLSGVMTLPDGAAADRKVPAVLLCQGLSGVKHLVLPEIARGLADKGLASLRFDYAGFGDSGGERGWIDPRARIDDALHAFAWLAAHEAVDRDRLGVYGHSYGGAVAIGLAARERRARAVVSVSGPGSGEALLSGARAGWDWVALKARLDEERTRVALTGQGTLVGVSELLPFSPAFAAAYAKLKAAQGGSSALEAGDGVGISRFRLSSADAMLDVHPEDSARRLGGRPLLLVHGEADDIATIEAIAPIYANAPGPKRLVTIPRAGHNDLDAGSGLARAIELAAGWFVDYL